MHRPRLDRVVIAGVDEAGRGPVLGPLVVAAVACEDPSCLAELGVKDSKRLSPARRTRLDRLIRDLPGIRVAVQELGPAELDAQRGRRSLNDIEVTMFQAVACEVSPRTLYLDAADVDAARFGRQVAHGIPVGVHVVSEHKADDRYPVVAAASIVAKVRRDAAIDALRRRLERRLGLEMGSGYPSDPRTHAFLAAWLESYGEFPEGTRRTWRTVSHLWAAHLTPRLDTFAAATP